MEKLILFHFRMCWISVNLDEGDVHVAGLKNQEKVYRFLGF